MTILTIVRRRSAWDVVMEWVERKGCDCGAEPGDPHTCLPGIVEQAMREERNARLAAEAERDAANAIADSRWKSLQAQAERERALRDALKDLLIKALPILQNPGQCPDCHDCGVNRGGESCACASPREYLVLDAEHLALCTAALAAKEALPCDP